MNDEFVTLSVTISKDAIIMFAAWTAACLGVLVYLTMAVSEDKNKK